MARYSQKRGPAAAQELTGTFVVVSGLTINRFFDRGELLIVGGFKVENSSATLAGIGMQIQVDGINIFAADRATTVPPGGIGLISGWTIQAINEGTHSIEVRGRGETVSGDVVVANSGLISVIQLPLWDSEEDISLA